MAMLRYGTARIFCNVKKMSFKRCAVNAFKNKKTKILV